MNWACRLRKLAGSLSIPPAYIYDGFTITLFQQTPDTDEIPLLDDQMNMEKVHIVETFLRLMRDQVAKYASRPDRYIAEYLPQIQRYPTMSALELSQVFNQFTTRSKNHRNYVPEEVNNTRWGEIAMAVHRLEQARGYRNIAQQMITQNSVFNLIHNTGTRVLEKFANGAALMAALEECHSGNTAVIIAKSSREVRQAARKCVFMARRPMEVVQPQPAQPQQPQLQMA